MTDYDFWVEYKQNFEKKNLENIYHNQLKFTDFLNIQSIWKKLTFLFELKKPLPSHLKLRLLSYLNKRTSYNRTGSKAVYSISQAKVTADSVVSSHIGNQFKWEKNQLNQF